MSFRQVCTLILLGAALATGYKFEQMAVRHFDRAARYASLVAACLNGRTLIVGNRIVTCVVTDVATK